MSKYRGLTLWHPGQSGVLVPGSGPELLLPSTQSSVQTEKRFENCLLGRAAFSPKTTLTLGFALGAISVPNWRDLDPGS